MLIYYKAYAVTGVIFNILWLIVCHYFQLTECIFPVHFILPIALFTGRATVSADRCIYYSLLIVSATTDCRHSRNGTRRMECSQRRREMVAETTTTWRTRSMTRSEQ